MSSKQSGQFRRELLDNPHDRGVEPSSLSLTVQRVLVGIFLLGLLLAVVFLMVDRWRRGSLVLGAALVYLGMIRWLVDSSTLGVLAVRSRKFDSCFTILLGALTVFLAASVDELI